MLQILYHSPALVYDLYKKLSTITAFFYRCSMQSASNSIIKCMILNFILNANLMNRKKTVVNFSNCELGIKILEVWVVLKILDV